MAFLKPYVTVARPAFLLLSLTLVASGAAARAYEGAFQPVRTIVALVGLVALHAAVDALNEASDMWRGIDLHTRRTPFSGGTGTLPSGALGVRQAAVFGLVLSAIGLVCGIWLVGEIGTVLVAWIVAGAVLVLGYTDVFARLGLGEIAAGLGLGLLPVTGVALVQDGAFGAAAWAAGVPAFFLTFNLLFLNEFPDEAADRQGGRRNLVLLLGRRWAARLYVAVALAAAGSIVVAVAIGALPLPALIGVLPAVLFKAPIQWALTVPEQEVPIPAMGANVMGILGMNSLLAVGLVVAAAI